MFIYNKFLKLRSIQSLFILIKLLVYCWEKPSELVEIQPTSDYKVAAFKSDIIDLVVLGLIWSVD
jgi:hypothetical protein